MLRYHKNPEALSRLSPEQYRVTQRTEPHGPLTTPIGTIRSRVFT